MFDNNSNNGERRPRPRFRRESEPVSARPRFTREDRPAFGERRERPAFSERPAFGERRERPAFGERSERPNRPNSRPNRPNRPAGQKPKRNNNLYSAHKQQVYHEEHIDPTKPVRLNKYLANAGICSRREADDFIQAGVITVNGVTVDNLGAKVLPTDDIRFHDQPVRRERKVYILLNKPKNTVTTTDDPQERHTVIDIVRNACPERIYPVGRLDRNTTGVLLLTNDGDLAAKLTHPKFHKKKIYAVTLDKELDEVDEAMLRNGVTLDDERIVPDALEFPKPDRRHIGLEIHSGQNRVSFAGLTKKNVGRGKWRFLTPKEVSFLQMGNF
jgi:23S rRNA pseudouridine2605 synthase